MNAISKWCVSIVFLTSFLFFTSFDSIKVFATDSTDVSTVEKISENAIRNTLQTSSTKTVNKEGTTEKESGTITMEDIDGSKIIPNTTIEDANQWVAKKGNDLVGLGGTIAEPLAIAGFIIGLFITLAGALAKSSYIIRGLMTMAISIVVYVGAVFAPEIVHYFSTWLSS